MTKQKPSRATSSKVSIVSSIIDDTYSANGHGRPVHVQHTYLDEAPLFARAADRAIADLVVAARRVARDCRAIGGGASGAIRKQLMAHGTLDRMQAALAEVLAVGGRFISPPYRPLKAAGLDAVTEFVVMQDLAGKTAPQIAEALASERGLHLTAAAIRKRLARIPSGTVIGRVGVERITYEGRRRPPGRPIKAKADKK